MEYSAHDMPRTAALAIDHHNGDTLAEICCGGYVFHMSDGSPFHRTDVEPVGISETSYGSSTLYPTSKPIGGVKRKRRLERCADDYWNGSGDESNGYFDIHVCADETPTTTNRFVVANRCNAWNRLSDKQREILVKMQDRVDADRNENRFFSCVFVEGPGGSGKTRLMSHLMNHRRIDTLVLYTTKQNKRVQDFIHTDCLNGEPDPAVLKPIDLTPKTAMEIKSILSSPNGVGRFAVTAEKLVYALAGLSPRQFHREATVSGLGIKCDLFDESRHPRHPAPAGEIRRNIVIMIDEYTMLQPPLVIALAYYLRTCAVRSPLLLLLAGDKLQCGPVGWNGTVERFTTTTDDKEHFSADLRSEISAKTNYPVLDLKMENLQRCRGDRALGGCVKRLRRVCEKNTGFPKQLINLILTRYGVESGVSLYRKETDVLGTSRISEVEPVDTEALLDLDGTVTGPANEVDFDKYLSDLEHEDLDERGVELRFTREPPINPSYDLTSLVDHFTDLFTRLATITFTQHEEGRSTDLWRATVNRSVVSIRHLFPAIIVLKNTSCNRFAETFLLALSSKVRERVLNVPVPVEPVDSRLPRGVSWTDHLKSTVRRCIRSLTINEDFAIQRQTLFVGMVYKMTSTFNSDPDCYLCNGEPVVLTSIVFEDDTLRRMNAVTLRKLERDADTDLTLCTGLNRNRMTNDKRMNVMPFVPYVSENIYQMQGNTMPKAARAFLDLTDVSSNSVYVAVSRFQNSESLKGIVISE